MNKFKLATILVIFLAIGTISANAHDKNYEPILAKPALQNQPVCVGTTPVNYEKLYGKVSNKLQAVKFVVFDSLANSLSYHTRSTTPFIWNPDFDILATVKRGSKNPDEIGVDASNSKNNLFLRTSTDRGLTWAPAITGYNEYDYTYGGARYPSMTSFKYENEFTMAFTCSMVFEAASQWNGYITGISGETVGTANLFSQKCIVGGTSYDWGVSDAALAAGTNQKGEFYILGAGRLTPTAGGSLTDNGNIGLRKTIEFNDITYSIPPQWASNKYFPVDTIVSAPCEGLGFRYRKDGKLYYGVFGNFINNQTVEVGKLGFSTSDDYGATWTEFTVMPANLFKDYGGSLGINPDSSFVGYQSKDFTVLANGDVYFVVYFFENDASKLWPDSFHQILAVKYSAADGNWSISKIADITGLWINPIDDSGNTVGSGADNELEIARTIDESTLLVKYVDQLGVQWTDDTHYTFQTNDIFVSTHAVGSTSWSTPANITEDGYYNLNTMIPEIIPNDLKSLPIMETHTILQSGEELGTSGYPQAARSYLRHQWVLSGTFDGIVSVEDENQNVTGLKINRIFPNPSTGNSNIEFSTSGNGNVEINITDLLGNVVLVIYNGLVEEGAHSFNFNTSSLMNGAYYVSLKAGNKTVTELVSVVR